MLERLGYVTLIECQLETGRTHQIRAHMKHIGHTLFNDERYGGNAILKGTSFGINNKVKIASSLYRVMLRKTLGLNTQNRKMDAVRFGNSKRYACARRDKHAQHKQL